MAGIVRRHVSVARFGKSQELVSLFQEVFGEEENVRIYSQQFGPAESSQDVVVEWEFSSLAALEEAANEFFGTEKSRAFYARWIELVDSHHAEIWSLS